MALHPNNNLSSNISTFEMMKVIYRNEGNLNNYITIMYMLRKCML